MSAALWITEADVVRVLDMHASIEALRSILRLEAVGHARNMPKTVASWGDGDTLHAIGAAVPGVGLAGTKSWAHTEGGATPLLVLWNAQDGSLAAIIEAFALGQLRTAAVSAVATDLLARPDATEMAMIGSGQQALPQVAAVAAVRALRRVRVFSPTASKRHAFAAALRARFAFDVIEAENVDDAVRGADVVTLATRATTPFLKAAVPAAGAHINAMGAIVPSRIEFEPKMLERCAVVAADSPEQTRVLSNEFQAAYAGDQWSAVRPLSELIAGDRRRPDGADLTLFKAMGMGLSDVALGQRVLAAARLGSFGKPLEAPRRVPITFSAPATV